MSGLHAAVSDLEQESLLSFIFLITSVQPQVSKQYKTTWKKNYFFFFFREEKKIGHRIINLIFINTQ